jgi:uncharacterized protein
MSGSTPVKRWHTREDSGIRLDRQLRWWHDDELIEHPKIVEAFNMGLAPAEDGRFRLSFGRDWCYVEVEDAAYAVTAVDVVEDRVWLRLSDRTAERLDPPTLAQGPDGVLTCRVKAGKAKARFSRDAQFALGSLLEEEHGEWVLKVAGSSVRLPRSEP